MNICSIIICLILIWTTNVKAEWITQTLDEGVGTFNSIAIDKNNNVHISYKDGTNSALKYATNISGSWIYTTVDNTGNMGYYSSIAVDSNNKVHISYLEDWNKFDLRYATNVSGSWVYSTLDTDASTGWYTSIAVDSNNKIHISYQCSGYDELKYATNVSGSWVYTVVDTSVQYLGYDTSIAIDSNNKIHISYGSYDDLKYATNSSGTWVYSTVDSTGDVGNDTSIAIDSNNKVHISHYDSANDDLKYTTNVSGIWITSTIDSIGDVGSYTSIAIDSNNKIHISYYDATNGDLKYATNISGSWVCSTVDNIGDVGSYTSIAIDSNNKIHISYCDSTNGDLKYAVYTPIDPTTTTTAVPPDKDANITITPDSGEMKVEIPSNSFKENINMTVSSITSFPEIIQSGLKKSNLGIEIKLDKNLQPEKEITITINYRSSDIFGLDENKLVIGYYNEDKKIWIKILSTVYAEQNKIVGKTKHLSKFQILQLTSTSDLSNVIAYPTPYKPNSGLGHTRITFKGLTSTATIKIFTITGELVNTFEENDGDGIYEWDVRNDNGKDIASGTYIYFVTNSAGEKVRGKIVVIR